MSSSKLQKALWSAVVSAPIALIAHDHLVCVVPAPIRNAGLTIAEIRADEHVVCTRALPQQNQTLVVYTNPYNSRERCCGRIVGLPGDVYIEDNAETGLQSIQRLHPGQVYVLDESESEEAHWSAQAVDSRDFGPLPAVMIEGSPLAAVSWQGMRWLR